MKTYTIYEYQSFTRGKDNSGQYKALSIEAFDKLRQFVIESKSSETDALDLMTVSYKKGVGEIITAKNYVGLIAMGDGTVIEILPKIANVSEENKPKVRTLLLDMLRTVKDLPFKTFNKAHFSVDKLPLLEVFISMFVAEVKSLLQKGLKSDYVLHQENEMFLKGKLLFNEHLKHNLTHKERFYVSYHLYNLDRAENRIIKTTLRHLFKLSKFAKNKKDLQTLLLSFDEAAVSKNIAVDFELCSNGRDMKTYEQTLQWCSIFLQGSSFTNLQGNKLATALLFPMVKLFESYVAEKLRKALDLKLFNLSAQDSKHHLFEKKFALRPDIVVEHKQEANCVVLDTKWKLLSPFSSNYGIAQGDMYQMYAYGKKYGTEKVVLLYPSNELIAKIGEPINFPSPENDDVNVHVRFLDLAKENFIDEVVAEFF